MIIAGEKGPYGNRLFDFDFAASKVIFKPKRGIKIEIKFALSKKQREELLVA